MRPRSGAALGSFHAGSTLRHNARNLRHISSKINLGVRCDARYVSGAKSFHARPDGSIELGSDFRPTRLVTTTYDDYRRRC
jgi:hypothetical protein